jgi:hypothetical protein
MFKSSLEHGCIMFVYVALPSVGREALRCGRSQVKESKCLNKLILVNRCECLIRDPPPPPKKKDRERESNLH